MLASSDEIEGRPMPPSVFSRRDLLLHAATLSTGAFAVGYGAWGLIHSMAPSEDVVAEQRYIDALLAEAATIDLRQLPENQYERIIAYGRPIAILHRTKRTIAAAEAIKLTSLRDPLARNANLPAEASALDQNRRATPDGSFIAYSLVCPKQGCVVTAAGSHWTCTCDGSEFGVNGLLTKGPAARNLSIPPYRMLDPNTLQFQPRRG